MLKSIKTGILVKGSLSRNVLTIILGTIAAEAVAIIFSPIVARIYSPSDFGVFALYLSLTSVISVIATARYEFAILLPKKEEDSITICALIFTIVAVIAFLTGLLILIFHKDLNAMTKNHDIVKWIYLVPVTVFLSGIYQILYYWSVLKKRFKSLAVNKVCQSASETGIQLGAGFLHAGAGGLISGFIGGQIAANSLLMWNTWIQDRGKIGLTGRKNLKVQALRYKKFPVYSLLSALMNTLSNQMPNFFLGWSFGLPVVGYFELTKRILSAPIGLIASPILSVYKERASRDYKAQGNCRQIYDRVFKVLLSVSAPIFAAAFLGAPILIPFIFGYKWAPAGKFMQILSIMYFLRFIASPLSFTLLVAEKQGYELMWQIGLCSMTILSFIIGAYLKSAAASLAAFSLSYSVMYIIYILMSYKVSKGNISDKA